MRSRVYFVALVATLGLFEPRQLVADQPLTTSEISRAAGPAVVTIRASTSDGLSTGSGFIVDPSGTIVTNLHVVEGANSLAVRLATGEIYDQVRIRAFDARRDIAIIQVAGFGLPTVQLGDSNAVAVGEPVVLIGNPLGVLDGSVSSGIVSGIRDSEAAGRLIQTDAAANPGNSGGPLLNSAAQVVGVLSFKLGKSENLNFVIPVNYVRGLLGSPESYDLKELAVRLGSAGSTDLFTEKEGGFPKRWKSLVSANKFLISLDGEHLYIERQLTDIEKRDGTFVTWEAKRSGENYIGVQRVGFPCTHYGLLIEQNFCRLEMPVELTRFSPTRIEGTMRAWPNDAKFNCKKCEYKGERVELPFTWIPE